MENTNSGWPLGYRINPRVDSAPADLIDAFRKVPVAVASDCMGRIAGAFGLRAYHGLSDATACGPAFTVRVRPGDNLMIHKALLLAQVGDFLVVDGGGDISQALVGGLMRAAAMAKRLAGFVIDGAVRDVRDWAEGGMPIFARSHTHRGPTKDGPGEINVPVSCAGMTVLPGDLVLADDDGVTAIPVMEARAVLERALQQLGREAMMLAANAAGKVDQGTVDGLLRAKGVPI
jgi:regulator of RNase E activity RraA